MHVDLSATQLQARVAVHCVLMCVLLPSTLVMCVDCLYLCICMWGNWVHVRHASKFFSKASYVWFIFHFAHFWTFIIGEVPCAIASIWLIWAAFVWISSSCKTKACVDKLSEVVNGQSGAVHDLAAAGAILKGSPLSSLVFIENSTDFFWRQHWLHKLSCGVATDSKKALTQLSLSNYKSHPQQKFISKKKNDSTASPGDSTALTFVRGVSDPLYMCTKKPLCCLVLMCFSVFIARRRRSGAACGSTSSPESSKNPASIQKPFHTRSKKFKMSLVCLSRPSFLRAQRRVF